jgi:cellulose synthase/poly-beta-1,6-N-acetylglucosamine synthase-like glycosyltransferase
MIFFNYTFYIVSFILLFFLVFPFVTVLLSLLRKDKTAEKVKGQDLKEYDYANIITAYRNAEIAKPLIQSLLLQTHSKHHIYLLADNCDMSNWDLFDERLTVLNPQPALNLKVKSIIYATERFVRDHEYTVIWDADNLAHPYFLETVNQYANLGYKAIQGQRTAKNLDTMMAAADSLGEFYKNYVERQVPPLLGSSTVISGSGMAVEQDLYESYLYGEEITKGKELWKKMMQEDKILQNHILRAGEQIVYAQDALCYDEKVTSANEVETQRSRWLFSYFQNIPNSTGFILKGLFTFNWNKLFFGLVTASLPLFILIGTSGLIFLMSLMIDWRISAAFVAAISIFIGNIFFCLYLSNVPSMVWSAVHAIPTFVLRQFMGLFKMFNPNKNFKHSEHKVAVSIDEVMKNK